MALTSRQVLEPRVPSSRYQDRVRTSPTRWPTVLDGCCAGRERSSRRAAATAAQLYAMLGDTLNRMSALINERLTMNAAVFFPLTVSTGFFGMNLGWLVENIGSLAAFLVFGITLPAAVIGVTIVGARFITGE